jgi:hypothetical protein
VRNVRAIALSGKRSKKWGVSIAYSEVFREIRPTSFLQELQEGQTLRNLHTSAMITATQIAPDGDRSEATVHNDDLRAAMAKRHEAMIDGDEDVVDWLTATEPRATSRITGVLEHENYCPRIILAHMPPLGSTSALPWNT